MPYARSRTQIQMAPLNMLPGIKLRQAKLRDRSAGMGDVANCPSLEQLMGISDPSDPCQAGVTPTTSQLVSNLPSGLNMPLVSIPNQAPVTPSLSSWLNQNSGIVIGVGAGLFGLVILKALSK